MVKQHNVQYDRIAEAIMYIKQNFKDQPNLEDIAEKVHVSPFYFQRLFKDWVGLSPKKFLQFTSVEYAKEILKDQEATLFDVAYKTGLSGTGRLHDLFIKIEGMTPGEYKKGAQNLEIKYSYAHSLFGEILVASTSKGVCYMSFVDNQEQAFEELKLNFPNASFKSVIDHFQQNALSLFTNDWSKLEQIKLHLKGTDFQLKVWNALLKIPQGGLITYGGIAKYIDKPKASRAVGTAIGNNPIAFLIPCHRVIQATGNLGQYHWGSVRKTAMIGWEAAQIHQD
ncbi:methylated-DNA--[protein]-cysteine S-methyltransferase [Aquimarina sp. AD10]|uniref:bifunctional helix-turn-helix domain-containing protein/methylated-DNA--[protein]-cysteine S-methyltransferase n=1 Tax=Aquimarina sp. AD10 TaxID=1714849 RepID=UPI000E4A5B0E|nr:methylated-DNA--[protein]-cysteine S-methyltransferase [Aquimarina sp. AD10]AXT60613.1 methylated-DNA--[protein]-cysteine S-methyltransferase [Aquimarina sp. AD10]RKN01706.1 methylated-DNA--[protein]-cysteine S-methyltransferase [Aquimarina sp. AD10]